MWSSSRPLHRRPGPSRSGPARASASAPARVSVLLTLGVALAAGGACTRVQVEETKVAWEGLTCSSPGGASGNGRFGNQQQPAPASTAVMDTYIVEIFELNSPEISATNNCEVCLASKTKTNCFLEEAICTCGTPVPVAANQLPALLEGVRVGLPASASLYCLRVMAVERTSQPESCACDPRWEQADRVRLCALSTPYGASPVAIPMSVRCSTDTNAFATCLGGTAP
jgi:hypothetical protein